MTTAKVAIIPGNGMVDVFQDIWYGWLHEHLNEVPGIKCDLRNMPDPITARKTIWLPFMRDQMNCDKNTVIVGHSSGAEAAMRFAETDSVKGIILVSAYVTDTGNENEKASGYFDDQWQWKSIRNNTNFIVQFGSSDDPFIPWAEQQEVADNLKSELIKFQDKGHFMTNTFPELFDMVVSKVNL